MQHFRAILFTFTLFTFVGLLLNSENVYAHESRPEPPPIEADYTAKTEKSTSKMRGRHWNVPQKETDKEDEVEKEGVSKKKDISKKDNSSEKVSAEDGDKELTPDQKIWEKYKALAEGGKKKSAQEKKKSKNKAENPSKTVKSQTGEEGDNSEDTESDDAKNNEKQQSAQAKGVLQQILQKYKSSQSQKGAGMKSRSFGDIE